MRRWITVLTILVLLITSGCGAGPAKTPTSAPPTDTPASVATATPEVAPTEFSSAPTVTPYVEPTQEPGSYYNPDNGVRLNYPVSWSAETVTDDPWVVLQLAAGGRSVFGVVGVDADPWPEGTTVQDAAAPVFQAFQQQFENYTVQSEGSVALDNGNEAWAQVFTCTLSSQGSDAVVVKGSLTVVLEGTRSAELFFYGLPGEYDARADTIEGIIKSMQLEAPRVAGIPRNEALFLLGGESTNPREYDPATTHGSGDKRVFSGLVSFDPQMQLVPELAESWDVKDGTVYTFHLRTNAQFHDGRPVTAQDVVYSWERAANPDTGSDTALTYLGDIVGVKEMNEGKADHISGLQVIDDHTLQVTIDAPKPYFILKLTYPTAFVLDKKNVESGSEWYRTPNGTGPYRLTRWDRFKLMVYERNDNYYLEPPAIRYIVIQLYSGVGIRLFETGDIDVSGVSRRDVSRVLDPKDPLHEDLLSSPDLCTSYYTFDVNQPPFDDPKVRQAFTMAFDRNKYIDVVLSGVGLPAEGLYPPALPGYNADLQGLPYDPERARQLLAESKYGGPQGLPPIVFTSSGNGSDIGADVALLANMWQENLGITITVENLEPDRYLDEIYAGRHGQIFSQGWCADYPDPENFADVLFHTGSEQNQGNYSNPEVDALLEQARVEPDTAKRIELYQQIEQMIVQDAPALFTVHGISYVLVKPYVKGYALTPVDIPLERYLQLEPR